MSDATGRFALPFILPGQAQKELYHNEALVRADMLLHPSVEGAPANAPPGTPAEGRCWLVGTAPTGAWQGRPSQIACWTAAGWRFAVPREGTCVWNAASKLWIYWDGAAWSDGHLPAASLRVAGQQVVGARQPAVLSPSGGTVIDDEARAAVVQVIAALKSHGLIS